MRRGPGCDLCGWHGYVDVMICADEWRMPCASCGIPVQISAETASLYCVGASNHPIDDADNAD